MNSEAYQNECFHNEQSMYYGPSKTGNTGMSNNTADTKINIVNTNWRPSTNTSPVKLSTPTKPTLFNNSEQRKCSMGI